MLRTICLWAPEILAELNLPTPLRAGRPPADLPGFSAHPPDRYRESARKGYAAGADVVDEPATPRMHSANAVASNGFLMTASTRVELSRARASIEADTTTIGMLAVLGSDRSRSISAKPSRTGIFRSVTTTSGNGFGLMIARASWPCAASTTANPSISRISLSSDRVSESSSTTRTVLTDTTMHPPTKQSQ